MRGSLAVLAVASVARAALPTVTRSGRYLAAGGERFLIKGIAYQPEGQLAASSAANSANGGFPEPSTYTDPLSVVANCERDLPNLQTLGINTIRVYSVNSAYDHSGCMNLFAQNGIYVIADLSLPLNGSIDRASPSWDVGLLQEYQLTLDNLAQYPNLMAVNIGNEVVTAANNSDAAPFVKAAARDIKAYINSKNYSVLVGYAAVDGTQWRTDLAQYLNCGSANVSIDLYGLNNYGCGQSTYAESGYQSIEEDFQNLLNIPAYFSEFGCVSAGTTRTWEEVATIWANPMLSTFSGAVAFEYFYDALGFGMTNQLSSVNATTITTTTDFTNLATAYNAVANTTTLPAATTIAYPTCPTTASADLMATGALPPTPDLAECNCYVQNAFSCTVNSGTSALVVGTLLNYVCGLLGQAGSSCAALGANGTTGVYGEYSACSAQQKLDAAFTAYYTLSGANVDACNFSGNATINSAINPSNAAAAVSSCQVGVSSTFTPSLASATGTATGAAQTAANAAVSVTSSSSPDEKSAGSSLQTGASAAAGLLGMALLAVIA